MIYLASPYTSSEPGMPLYRFQCTEYHTAKFMKLGFPIFSPIVHCHELAKKYGMPTTFEYWWKYNEAFLRAAEELWVLCLPGWDKSMGVLREIEWWEKEAARQAWDKPLVVYKEVD